MAVTSEQAKARALTYETPEKMRDAPDELRKALRAKAEEDPKVADIKDDLLKACEQPDIYLLRFLRVRKYDIDASVSNVVGWFKWLQVQQNLPTELLKAFKEGQGPSSDGEKVEGPELTYWGCKAADVKDVLESNAFGVLPGYTKDGSKCMCISDVGEMIGLMKTHPVKNVMLGTTYLLEQLSFDPNTQVCGLALVYDMENYSISLLKELMRRKDFMELQKKKAAAMNDAYPFRFAEMWMFDPPWYFNLMWVPAARLERRTRMLRRCCAPRTHV
jgi:hypothetical protein